MSFAWVRRVLPTSAMPCRAGFRRVASLNGESWGVLSFCSIGADSSVTLKLVALQQAKIDLARALERDLSSLATKLNNAADCAALGAIVNSEATEALAVRKAKMPALVRRERLCGTIAHYDCALDDAWERLKLTLPDSPISKSKTPALPAASCRTAVTLEARPSASLDPTARVLLLGTSAVDSPFALLSGQIDLLRLIYERVRVVREAAVLAASMASRASASMTVERKARFQSSCSSHFVHVNMLPFVMGDAASLPDDCRHYFGLVDRCLEVLPPAAAAQVGYLTIDEGWVEEATSQRRPGAHTDGFRVEACAARAAGHEGRVIDEQQFNYVWGGGVMCHGGLVEGGIFLCSSVANTTRIWDCVLPPELIGASGDIEHLRADLEAGCTSSLLDRNQLVWMTDRTPHESLPPPSRTFRRFFRLVAGPIDVWYAAHSTPNPRCAPAARAIALYDKFTGALPPTPSMPMPPTPSDGAELKLQAD